MLVRGDALVDGFHEMSVRAIVLVTLLLLCLALFCVSLFVMLVVAGSQLDFEAIASRSWWEKKLAFHYTAADLGLPNWVSSTDHGLGSIGVTERLEHAWNLLILSIVGGTSKRRKHWYEGVPTNDVRSWPLWTISIIVIPLWVVLGMVTLGLLWPPQLRRILFRPFAFSSERVNKALGERASSNISATRDEVRQLKLLSYERSGEIERELKELKELLYSAIKES
jgi:hypothetical protein